MGISGLLIGNPSYNSGLQAVDVPYLKKCSMVTGKRLLLACNLFMHTKAEPRFWNHSLVLE